MGQIGSYQRISISDLNKVLKDSRVSERNREVARRVMVNGEMAADVAKEIGVTPTTVYALCRRIYEGYMKRNNFPPDWVTVEVTAPKKEIEKFVKRMEVLRAQLVD